MIAYENFTKETRPFVEWMLDWYNNLPTLPITDVVKNPDEVAVASIDLIKGFTTVGILASPRIAKTTKPTGQLFQRLWDRGVRRFALLQDSHPEDAVEFAQYGAHCITGTVEAEPIEEFTELPFFDQMEIMPKNSISASLGTDFEPWLQASPQVNTYIAVGDCSDICTYQLAMHLRLRANAANTPGIRVIAPVNTIDTYDLPVETALKIGATPHDGQFLHVTFLYHMKLNGVEVVRAIEG
jgi:nicotinamidase-related amidase